MPARATRYCGSADGEGRLPGSPLKSPLGLVLSRSLAVRYHFVCECRANCRVTEMAHTIMKVKNGPTTTQRAR
jgi:hypothetical protein